MFADYYSILEIHQGATTEQIKEAYKKQVKIWHPDVSISTSSTQRMQSINEAYLILKDAEARRLYDVEYERYKLYIANIKKCNNSASDNIKSNRPQFEVYDATLSQWILNAKEQAIDLARKSLKDLIGISRASGSVMANEFIPGLLRLVFFSIVILILRKACN
jgi:curved DNA-binding protein CbpA